MCLTVLYALPGRPHPPIQPKHLHERRWHHSVSLSLILDQVGGDSAFKAEVASELAEIGDRIDLRPLVREYVAALAEIQQIFRGVTSDDYHEAAHWIEELIERYEEEEGSVVGLGAVRSEGGDWVERMWLVRDPIDRVKALVARHFRTGGIEHQFVTNDPTSGVNSV